MSSLRAAAAEFSLWVTPALLFSIPAELLTGIGGGIWIGLLVVVGPMLGCLLARAPGERPTSHPASAVCLGLVGFILLSANFLLVGDTAQALGVSRVAGVFIAGATVFLVTTWAPLVRWGAVLAPVALLVLLLPLGGVAARADRPPLAAWSHAASPLALRFSPESPWVTEGRAVRPRRGNETLLFEEEHRITPLAAGPLRILVSDGGRVRVQEWTLAANQSVTVRPGDRLMLEPGRRLRFEAGKRIPGAPEVSWARRRPSSPGFALLALLGSGVTLVGGATALLVFGRSAPVSRTGVAVVGAGCILALAWAEGWAVYTAVMAPELFLGGLAPEKMIELPALAFRGSPWGFVLSGLVLLGGLLLLLASASALGDLAVQPGLRSQNAGRWGAVVGGAALLSLWPFDPWNTVLLALGLGASTLAPLAWVGGLGEQPRAIGVALGAGGSLFLGLTVAGQFVAASGSWSQIAFTHPALAASPVAALLLWRLRRAQPNAGLSSSPTWTRMKG